MNKWIAPLIFSVTLHAGLLIGYGLSLIVEDKKVKKKITKIKFIQLEAETKKIAYEINKDIKPEIIVKSQTRNELSEKMNQSNDKNEENLINIEPEIVDSISEKVILDIQKIWISPNNLRDNISAEFLLIVDRSGNIQSMQIIQSSGIGAFDRSAQSAIRKYGKIPYISALDEKTYREYFSEFTLRFKPR